MQNFKNQLVMINNDEFTKEQLVSILVLIESKLDIDTISETARKEGKTPRGIKTSNQYRKINIGKQTFAITGVKDCDLPF